MPHDIAAKVSYVISGLAVCGKLSATLAQCAPHRRTVQAANAGCDRPFFLGDQSMQDILVLGAGKIGALISGLLSESGDYRVQLADSIPGVAADVVSAHNNKHIVGFDLDASDKDALTAHVSKYKPSSVVSGLPFYCNVAVAEVARNE